MNNTNFQFAGRIKNVQKSFIREILKVASDPKIISFAGGLPNPQVFPVQAIKRACNQVIDSDGPEVMQYSTTEGYAPLRAYIAKEYNQKHQLDISPENILITNGSQQGLDLTGKVFIEKNDRVIIEKPGYLGAIQAFSIFQPEFIPVTLNEDGLDLEELGNILSNNLVKLCYTVPSFQNPSGITYSVENRKAAAGIFEKSDVIVIEDNPYGEISFDDQEYPPIGKWLGRQSIMLGSFSKTVVPSFRLGWICADKEIMEKLIVAKQAADLHTNYFCQKVVYQLLTDFDFKKHIETTRNAYKLQCETMIAMIKQYFPPEIKYTQPRGGMFIWVTLPEGMSSIKLFDIAIRENVAFVPGNPFFVDGGGSNTLRLNYSNSSPEQIAKGIKILAESIRKLL